MNALAPIHPVRPLKPHAKVISRLHREAISAAAAGEGSSRLDIEDRYTNTRSALVHLLKHDRYRTKTHDMVGEIMKANRALLDHPDAVEYFGDIELANLKRLREHVADISATRPEYADTANRTLHAAQRVLENPKAQETLGALRVSLIDEAADDLKAASDDALKEFEVSSDDVALFLKIVETLMRLYEEGHWDTSEIIDPAVYALAQMIRGNFAAYHLTLNT